MDSNNWFVHHYDRIMQPLEKRSFTRIRANLLARAKGRVLELGCGTGINFPLYTGVDVTAIEPNDILRKSAERRAREAKASIEVSAGSAEQLPFGDGVFDTIVGTLVFCTIPEPVQAMREAVRVCKPGGRILLFEHVRHDHPALAALQKALNPLWKRMCDGCNLNRKTEDLLVHEGLEIVSKQTFYRKIFIALEARKKS